MASAIKLKNQVTKLEAAKKAATKGKNTKLAAKFQSQIEVLKGQIKALNKPTGSPAVQAAKQLAREYKAKYGVNFNGIDIEKDALVPALKMGRRISQGLKGNGTSSKEESKGNVYYEYRENHLDRNAKRYPKLEDGGVMAEGGWIEKPMTGGRKKYVKESNDYKHETFKQADGRYYVFTTKLSSKSGVDEYSQTYDTNVSDDFNSLEEAKKYVSNKYADGGMMQDGGMMAKGGRVNKKYNYFAVDKITGKIVTGFETKDVESLKAYYAKQDLLDMDLNPSDYKILSAKYLLAKGIDPFTFDNWRKMESMAKGGKIKVFGEIFENKFNVDNNDFESAIFAFEDSGSASNLERIKARRKLIDLQNKWGESKNKEVMEYIRDKYKSIGIYADGGMMEDGGIMANGGEVKEFNLTEVTKLSSRGQKILHDANKDNYYVYQNGVLYDAEITTTPPYFKKGASHRMSKVKLKFADGGSLDSILLDTGAATTTNIGGTFYSNANLSSQMDITDPMFAKGGKLNNYKYVPNRMIQAVEVERNGRETEIDGANVIDGLYVKKGVKFEHGGETHRGEGGSMFAMGGIIEHGLLIGDTILDANGDRVTVKNAGKFYTVNLNTGKRS